MTRAVIKFSNDISPVMPRLSKLIEGCAYNPEVNLLAFRFNNVVVNVESRQINISHIGDETIVKTFMDWFLNLLNGNDKK